VGKRSIRRKTCYTSNLSTTFSTWANPVAARSKAWVCGLSLHGIVGSNPVVGLNVCLLWVLRVVMKRSLRRANPSSRRVLPIVCASACMRVCVCGCHWMWRSATIILYAYRIQENERNKEEFLTWTDLGSNPILPMRGCRLTAWAMVRPSCIFQVVSFFGWSYEPLYTFLLCSVLTKYPAHIFFFYLIHNIGEQRES
jgi:hypothetical protein